jgi:hypothetical protein
MKQQEDFEAGSGHPLVVGRSAAVEIAVLNDPAERIDGPLLAFDSDHVYVAHQQQGFFLAVPFQASDQVSTPGFFLEYFGWNSLAVQDGFQILGAFGFVAWRVAGVDPHEARENLHRFISSGCEVRLSAVIKRARIKGTPNQCHHRCG